MYMAWTLVTVDDSYKWVSPVNIAQAFGDFAPFPTHETGSSTTQVLMYFSPYLVLNMGLSLESFFSHVFITWVLTGPLRLCITAIKVCTNILALTCFLFQ